LTAAIYAGATIIDRDTMDQMVDDHCPDDPGCFTHIASNDPTQRKIQNLIDISETCSIQKSTIKVCKHYYNHIIPLLHTKSLHFVPYTGWVPIMHGYQTI
jgi:hypothetical protein